MKVWREGDRIRQENGSGYADSVSDAAILRHIAADSAKRDGRNHAGAIDFACSVLLLRLEERGAVGLAPAASQEREGTG